jgi:hypothetical protein
MLSNLEPLSKDEHAALEALAIGPPPPRLGRFRENSKPGCCSNAIEC